MMNSMRSKYSFNGKNNHFLMELNSNSCSEYVAHTDYKDSSPGSIDTNQKSQINEKHVLALAGTSCLICDREGR